jgi:hypothetical protein
MYLKGYAVRSVSVCQKVLHNFVNRELQDDSCIKWLSVNLAR